MRPFPASPAAASRTAAAASRRRLPPCAGGAGRGSLRPVRLAPPPCSGTWGSCAVLTPRTRHRHTQRGGAGREAVLAAADPRTKGPPPAARRLPSRTVVSERSAGFHPHTVGLHSRCHGRVEELTEDVRPTKPKPGARREECADLLSPQLRLPHFQPGKGTHLCPREIRRPVIRQ